MCLCCYVSWRRSYHLASSIRCNICFCTYLQMYDGGRACRTVGAIQLRDVSSFFDTKLATNTKLKLPLQRHTFLRCQTSQLNIMLRTFPVCINPPPHYNVGEDQSTLSHFRGQLGSESLGWVKILLHEEWHTIMIYVL
jgi:hypothetical protein